MGIRNYLIDGVSGSGKTSVCDELHRRGHDAVHGDRELAYPGDPATGSPIDGVTGVAIHAHHLRRVDQVRAMIADHTNPVTFFCGGSRNADQVLPLFDEVFILAISAATLRQRLDERSPDEWAGAGREDERALVERLHATRSGLPMGTVIDADQPVTAVVDEILRRCGLPLT